jgi:molybdate transport system substrate-binding protein
MNRPIYITALVAILLNACIPSNLPAANTLTVFAAASLTDAFTEIGNQFEVTHPGVIVQLNFAGSQALRAQIEQGAVADIFASADQIEMSALVSDGLVQEDESRIFLQNQLVVILPAQNPAKIQGLGDLAKPGLKLVLAADAVPVGRYARQSLENMNGSFGSDFNNKVLANIVSNEDNVKQVVAKVELGEADAGIVYTSDAIAASGLKTITIPHDLNVTARYPIAPLAESLKTDLTVTFIAYVLSAEGQAILKKWGFTPVAQ